MLLDARDRSLANRIDDVLAALPAELAATPRPRRTRASWSSRRRRTRRSRGAVGELAAPAPALDGVAARRARAARGGGGHASAGHRVRGRRHRGRAPPARSRRRCARWRTASRRWRCTSTSRCPTAPRRCARSTACATTCRCCSRCRPTRRSGAAATRASPRCARRSSRCSRASASRGASASYARYVGGGRALLSSAPSPIRASSGGTRGCSRALGTRRGPHHGRPVARRPTSARWPRSCSAWCAARRGGGVMPRRTPEVLAENRFLAARDGMDAVFIDDRTAPRCVATCSRSGSRPAGRTPPRSAV